MEKVCGHGLLDDVDGCQLGKHAGCWTCLGPVVAYLKYGLYQVTARRTRLVVDCEDTLQEK
jgi:hypothetical protein